VRQAGVGEAQARAVYGRAGVVNKEENMLRLMTLTVVLMGVATLFAFTHVRDFPTGPKILFLIGYGILVAAFTVAAVVAVKRAMLRE
jgi:hypothetical protein